MTTQQPNGSRTQRAKRHLAEARRAALHSLADGRRQAVAAISTHQRRWAERYFADTEAGTLRHRIKEWAMNTVAKVVARSIERTTWKVALESRKLSFGDFVEAMQVGGSLTRMARQ